MKKRIKILICFGTRPEGIKLAPILKLLQAQKNKFEFTVCSSGQHSQMLNQVLDFFEIVPDIDLKLMAENQSLDALSARILGRTGSVLDEVKPDILLIQGDTTTAFLTALSAFYKKIKVGHVEAGLRTFDKYNPFPEEINRQLITKVTDFHFAPTEKSVNNLIDEKVGKENILLTGNTIVDALNWGIVKIQRNKTQLQPPLNKLLDSHKIILITMHRRESFGEDIKNVCRAINVIANKFPDVNIVYPVHLNPNVRGPVFEALRGKENIILTQPLDYVTFLYLMNISYLIVTDSGGVQEEAPSFKKPVLVIRKKTERTESIELGISKLVGTEEKSIIDSITELLQDEDKYLKMISDKNPYGDGKASEKILDFIYNKFGQI